jgi:hypothetical protein
MTWPKPNCLSRAHDYENQKNNKRGQPIIIISIIIYI